MPGTPRPPSDADAGDLATALDGQTTQLDRANGRSSDLIAIADTCQTRQQAVLEALNPPPWYERLFKPKAHRTQSFTPNLGEGVPGA